MFNGNINDLIGIPYKDRGEDLNGFDCAGLVRYITGIEAHLIPSVKIGHTKEVMESIEKHRRHFKVLKEPKEMCIVALSRYKHAHHVGVWINGGVIHAELKHGVIFSTLENLKINGYTYEFGELING